MRNFKAIFYFLIVVSIPILLVTSAIRLTLSPIFIQLEYRLPGFPEDSYGFSTADRLFWAQYSIEYLLGRITHNELTRQTLADGSSLFNQRELIHMQDVRGLTNIVLRIWRLVAIFSLIMFALAILFKHTFEWLRAVKRGSILTISLVTAIILFVAIDFNQLFTRFHMLFFEGDSWLFLPSDHLIRLFPLRFWQDVFIFIGVIIVILAIALIVITIMLQKKTTLLMSDNP